MTNAEAIKIAAAIRAKVDTLDRVSDCSPAAVDYAMDALTAVAEAVADCYAASPDALPDAYSRVMAACGL
jgi:hypothetical protein